MARKMTRGTCRLCEKSFSAAGMARHLAKCLRERAERSRSRAAPRPAFHIEVRGRYAPVYWMHVLMPADAELYVLDGFLRDTWVECCDHLSAFRFPRKRRPLSILAALAELEEDDDNMDAALADVLRPGLKFFYEYDFGSTTHLALRVVDRLEVRGRRPEVELLARNDPPVINCDLCGKPAAEICPECVYDDKGFLCEACAPKHVCEREWLLPVANSPRMGVCGYAGPPEGRR